MNSRQVSEKDKGANTAGERPPLRQIYFYLTGGCNLACRHCWIAPRHLSSGDVCPAIDVDLFKSIIDQAKPLGLGAVKLTGGEPLLHPRIMDILDFIRSEDIRLTVETNGVLCTPVLAREMAKGKGSFVSVSLDAAEPETHEWIRGEQGCFGKAIEGIKNLAEAGLRPQIIMTLMHRNKDQMTAVVQLAESLGAGSVKFNVLQPMARGERMHETGEALPIKELVDLGRWVETELAASTALPVFYHHPVAFRPLGRIFGNGGCCCGTCGILGILGILSDGSYALCGIGETVPDLIFGHAARDTLASVWAEAPVLHELREGMPSRLEDICGDCLMKRYCLGSCVAQTYALHRNLWSGYWYCEEARRKGLFPEARMKQIRSKDHEVYHP